MTEVNRRIAETSERCSLEELARKSDVYLLRILGFGKGSLRILRGMFPEIKGIKAIDDELDRRWELAQALFRIADELERLADKIDPPEKVGDNE